MPGIFTFLQRRNIRHSLRPPKSLNTPKTPSSPSAPPTSEASPGTPDPPAYPPGEPSTSRIMCNNGNAPDSGRRLHAWAREAGLPVYKDERTRSVGTWCFSSREEMEWSSGLCAERILESGLWDEALKSGIASGGMLLQGLGGSGGLLRMRGFWCGMGSCCVVFNC